MFERLAQLLLGRRRTYRPRHAPGLQRVVPWWTPLPPQVTQGMRGLLADVAADPGWSWNAPTARHLTYHAAV